MECKLHLNRLEVCNGQLSAEALCADRNCLFALESAEAHQAECGPDGANVPGFENVPSLDMLCGDPDGERNRSLLQPLRPATRLNAPCAAQS